MKNLNGRLVGIAMLAAIITLPVVSEAQQQPQQTQKTPITDVTYSVFQGSCQTSCKAAAPSDGRLDKDKVATYCACACYQATANVHTVVGKYSLKYEEELVSHQTEFMPSPVEINACKSKAGL